MDPQAVAALASRRTYPLNSSFRPTYNMAVNLIDLFGKPRARQILESSFAQFQADRAVVGLARQVREAEVSLAGYEKSMSCEHGDFVEYSTIRRELSDLEKKNRQDSGAPRSARDKRLKRIQQLRTKMQRHPCHNCLDREAHARWAERYWKLKRQTDRIRRQIETRTGTVARVFDRVVEVLETLDYLRSDGDEMTLTEAGRTMRRIYGERDLLVAESLRQGLWSGLDAPSLAAMACCLVYEPRRDEANSGSAVFRAVRSVPHTRRRRRCGPFSMTSNRIIIFPAPSRSPPASPERCTRGLAAGCWIGCSSMPIWRPATSSAGPSRRSTSSTSSRSSPRTERSPARPARRSTACAAASSPTPRCDRGEHG